MQFKLRAKNLGLCHFRSIVSSIGSFDSPLLDEFPDLFAFFLLIGATLLVSLGVKVRARHFTSVLCK